MKEFARVEEGRTFSQGARVASERKQRKGTRNSWRRSSYQRRRGLQSPVLSSIQEAVVPPQSWAEAESLAQDAVEAPQPWTEMRSPVSGAGGSQVNPEKL